MLSIVWSGGDDDENEGETKNKRSTVEGSSNANNIQHTNQTTTSSIYSYSRNKLFVNNKHSKQTFCFSHLQQGNRKRSLNRTLTINMSPTRFLSVLLFSLCCVTTQATITVIDTGERFASRQDSEYGPLLWKGYQYGGRLQMIDGNLPLCPDDGQDNNDDITKHKLIVPADGYSVALLARDGSCSLQEKLKYIQEHVEPWHMVHYLILDGSSKASLSEQEEELDDASVRTVQEEFERMEQLLAHQQQNNNQGEDDDVQKRDESIPIHVLHVSFRTEYKLLDILLHQSNTSRQDGGPRLAIDSKINTNRISDRVILAVAAVMLLCASLFSLGLLVHGNRAGWWEPPPPQAPPPRTNRRRLRRDQVKAMLPVYRFNGQELEVIPEETIITTTTPLLDEEGRACDVVQPRVPPLSAELDCCSICLDEYEEGDRVRCIEPCNHTFHSKCIGKWLVERSATCPLCKFDLYDSDDEDEEDEEGAEGNNQDGQQQRQVPMGTEDAGIQRFQAQPPVDFLQQQQRQQRGPRISLWGWRQERNQENSGEDGEPELASVEDQQEENEQSNTIDNEDIEQVDEERPNRLRRPWWQRMFRRSQPAVESLTEPLLSSEAFQPPSPHDAEPPVSNDTASPAPVPLEMGPASESAVEDVVAEVSAAAASAASE